MLFRFLRNATEEVCSKCIGNCMRSTLVIAFHVFSIQRILFLINAGEELGDRQIRRQPFLMGL